MSEALAELRQKHTELYKQFAPQMRDFSTLANQILEVQIQVVKGMVAQELPEVAVKERVEIFKISAREPLQNAENALLQIKEQGIEVVSIDYDPNKFEFRFYGKA